MVFRAIEEIGKIERQQAKVVCSIDARIYLPQKPFVVIHKPFLQLCMTRWRSVALECRTENGLVSGVNVVGLVQFTFEVGQSHHHCQVAPYVSFFQLQCFADLSSCAELCSRNLSSFYLQHTLTFQPVEILGEATSVCLEVMPFHNEHNQRVNLVKGIQDAEEIPWMSVCRDGEDVAERRRKQRRELFL